MVAWSLKEPFISLIESNPPELHLKAKTVIKGYQIWPTSRVQKGPADLLRISVWTPDYFLFKKKTFAPQITLLEDSANVLFTGMKTDLALSHIPSLNLFKSLSGTSLSFESKHWPHLSENQWSAVCLFFSGGWITALFQSFEDWICWNISTILSGPAASEWRCHRDSRKDVWNLVSPKHRSTLVSDHLP